MLEFPHQCRRRQQWVDYIWRYLSFTRLSVQLRVRARTLIQTLLPLLLLFPTLDYCPPASITELFCMELLPLHLRSSLPFLKKKYNSRKFYICLTVILVLFSSEPCVSGARKG